MTKIDIVSGFLGAGKTTLIKKLLGEAFDKEKVVLIENEFGEIGIDGGFLKDAGIEIKEMNSGCICCSLVGDFGTSLKEVLFTYRPDRILIEPSGVGKLSDVMRAVSNVIDNKEVVLNCAVAVVDAVKCKMYLKNFGEFFVNQIEHAGTIILSRTDKISEDKLNKCLELIREHNDKATIITTPWAQLTGNKILETIEGAKDLEAELLEEVMKIHDNHEHHHNHDDHEEEHHHDRDDHEEHHHDHDVHEEHHHEHEHGDDCTCGCHNHDHHHADEVFTSWGMETPAVYSADEIKTLLSMLEDEPTYGFVLRAKGMVPSDSGKWTYFDYVPGEIEVRTGQPDIIGKLCVIGSKLQEDHLQTLFAK